MRLIRMLLGVFAAVLAERPVPYLPEFLECRSGKVRPSDRPGLGVTVDERQLAFVEALRGSSGRVPEAARWIADPLVTVAVL